MLAFLLKHWRALGLVASLLGMAAISAWVTHRFDLAALAKQEARMSALERSYAEAARKASEDYRARETAARKHNDEVIRGYREELAAVALDRDAGARRLLDYQALLTRSRAAAETSGLAGAARAAYFAGRARELEEAVGRYDGACRADAAQLGALIAEIKPQL